MIVYTFLSDADIQILKWCIIFSNTGLFSSIRCVCIFTIDLVADLIDLLPIAIFAIDFIFLRHLPIAIFAIDLLPIAIFAIDFLPIAIFAID